MAARAAFPVLGRILGLAGVRALSGDAWEGVRTLLTMAVVVCYFVWFARFYGWVRATRGATQYSTGLAIGSWFIPFANFVMPYIALRDACRRGVGDKNGGLILVWWLSYWAMSLLQTFFQLTSGPNALIRPSSDMISTLMALGWLSTLMQIVTYGLWAFIVREMTRGALAGGGAPQYPQGQYPQPYPQGAYPQPQSPQGPGGPPAAF
jgi:hypothetical protein